MNKVIKFFFFVSVIFCKGYSQTLPYVTEALSNKIAQKMKDSLTLTEAQKNLVLTINNNIAQQKQVTRQQYAGTNLIRLNIQKVENTRDSLYRQVLPEDKYQLYKQKKRTLVNND